MKSPSYLSQAANYDDLMASETEAESFLTDLPKARGGFDQALSESLSTNFSRGSSQSSNSDNLSELSRDSSIKSPVASNARLRRRSIGGDIDLSVDPMTLPASENTKVEPIALDPKDKSISKAKMRKSVSRRRQSAATTRAASEAVGSEKEGQGDDEEDDDEEGGEGGIYDYYDILSIEKEDPVEKVIERYRKEIVMAEFERHSSDGKERIMEVAEAYVVLTDPSRRSLYDRTIEEEDLSLLSQWKPSPPVEPDSVFAEVFAVELKKELFKATFHYTPIAYISGAIIGYILFSWPGLLIFTHLCGRVGDWEDHRAPSSYQLVSSLTDNQRTALMHALSRSLFK